MKASQTQISKLEENISNIMKTSQTQMLKLEENISALNETFQTETKIITEKIFTEKITGFEETLNKKFTEFETFKAGIENAILTNIINKMEFGRMSQ
ncbi:1066_t:CDS:1, partial [Scutellospora calospora]